ncbi:uncharacterized protein PGTG_21012 [Puccinia graminis f. sp. tritici CRL 75-36-700-3]|uniref:Uncharacterized protein n=1 Tax=Puccinia graminis f. sp. tritici (strain CRL 75-36-700-3 / race SCCL) TaxID=418459 RepID=H6QQ33_PUCGT|nr:uncharacterized protein PGTG_21012 [Puccinia graminis f. sp. tritici CRL 75-36-700-3]EHS64661.1 hypothetical protein PGTG_21012 [Puccinia graminis f. sp. tritici CRL 75-36-700-3]
MMNRLTGKRWTWKKFMVGDWTQKIPLARLDLISFYRRLENNDLPRNVAPIAPWSDKFAMKSIACTPSPCLLLAS